MKKKSFFKDIKMKQLTANKIVQPAKNKNQQAAQKLFNFLFIMPKLKISNLHKKLFNIP